MSSAEVLAADAQAPMINESGTTENFKKENIAVIAVTTGSAETNLAAAAQLGDNIDSYYWTFQADGGDIYIAFARETGGVVDETATSGDTRCAKLNNGESKDWLINKRQFVVVKGSVACKLRISRSSNAR